MLVHDRDSANWHIQRQVPNDTLRKMPFGTMSGTMAGEFRRALMWHMEKHETKITDLARDAGVSRDVINKLRAREKASTDVENGVLIAAYYGKTLNQFLNMEEADSLSRAIALFELLPTRERQLLEAQIRGILNSQTDEPT